MPIYSESFTSTSGTWDAGSNWSQNGIPDTATTVAIGPSVSLVTAAGHDVFAQLDAVGSTAGGSHNTIDITGSLIDSNSNAGIHQITNFTVDVASNATLEAPAIATFSGSILDDFGTVDIFGSGLSNVSHATITIETGGSFLAPEITNVSSSAIDIKGMISLSGGGGLEGLNNDTVTIAAGGSLAAQQIANVANSSFDIEGNVSLSANGGINGLTGSTISIGSHGSLIANQIAADSSDTLIVNGDLTFNRPYAGDGLNGAHVTINAGGTVSVAGNDSYGQGYVINGGTYIGSSDPYSTDSFNYGGVRGGLVELLNDNRYGDNYTISNFAKGDGLILGTYASNASLTTSLVNGTLTIRDLSIQTSPYYTDPNIVYEDTNFSLAAGTTAADLHAKVVNGHVELVACFYPGTMLATPEGEIAVEEIVAGTVLSTTTGAAKVRWLGRSVTSTRFADPLRSLPIRIKAGALANDLPARDLLVSPCHAMFLGGVLVQAGALVNGVSIVREADVPEMFTYYHVELASHELLFAEGAATESFVDNVDRMHFENWAEHEALGELAPIEEMPYPRAKAARQVPAAVRRMLQARLARFATEQPAAA